MALRPPTPSLTLVGCQMPQARKARGTCLPPRAALDTRLSARGARFGLDALCASLALFERGMPLRLQAYVVYAAGPCMDRVRCPPHYRDSHVVSEPIDLSQTRRICIRSLLGCNPHVRAREPQRRVPFRMSVGQEALRAERGAMHSGRLSTSRWSWSEVVVEWAEFDRWTFKRSMHTSSQNTQQKGYQYWNWTVASTV